MPDECVGQLLKDYFASEPSPETAQAIDGWVREDPAIALLIAILLPALSGARESSRANRRSARATGS